MEEIYINTQEFLWANKQELLKPYISDNQISLSLAYDSDFKSAKILRDIIETICDAMSIDGKWKSRMTLITDEMNNNAIEYGTKQGEKNTMFFEIKKQGKDILIKIEVEDRGNGLSPKKAADMEAVRQEKQRIWFAHHHSIRGRGLFMIITTLVDELYFKDSEKGGLIVWVTKTLTN